MTTMGEERNIIVALEFGSSAICGIAGQKKQDGSLRILDIEIEKADESVQRGVIFNIDTSAEAISNIVERINKKLNIKVRRAFVGVAGQSLHTENKSITMNMEAKEKVTAQFMDKMMDDNLLTEYPASEILDVVPQEYLVGHHSVSNPVGIQTEKIEARYANVIAKSLLSENINTCMHKAGLDVAELLIAPITLADSILSESDKRSGCALVDFGAGTTTVSVYTSNVLRFLTVIPLGGQNITNDLEKSKQLYPEEAETIKRKHGIAYVPVDTDNPKRIPINSNRFIDENELQTIIGARQEEIILNAWEQIKPYKDKLLAGIITTGGASQMRDLTEAFKHFTAFDRITPAKSLITAHEVARDVLTPQDTNIDTLIALLAHGNDNCATPAKEPEHKQGPVITQAPPETEPEPKPKEPQTMPDPEPEGKQQPPTGRDHRFGAWYKKFKDYMHSDEEVGE